MDRRQRAPLAQSEGMLLTEKEAAAELRVSTRTLRSIRQSGRLEFVRIGRQIRYTPEGLEAFVEASTVRANPREPTRRGIAAKATRIVGFTERAAERSTLRRYEALMGGDATRRPKR